MRKTKFLWIALLLFSFIACEKEIEVNPKDGQEKLVVEGYIEPDVPPFVILTRSQPFFSQTNIGDLGNFFVSGAEIVVSDGANTVILQEIRSDTLPEALLDTISVRLGIDLASASDPDGLVITVYSTSELTGKVGSAYSLNVKAEGKELFSVTTIPVNASPDSLWFVPHPENDTLMTLYVRYSDPPGIKNFVRYFTSVNGDMFYPPYFNSVFDDRNLFNVDGKTFDFPLEKGHDRNSKIDFETYTYFTKGDTVLLRWAAIDQDHYNFWATAEFDRNSAGNPFSTPIRINSNIEGGLGVWGGYNPSYYQVIAQ